jgi:hypothetical protein
MSFGKLIDARTKDAVCVFMTSPLYTTAVNMGISIASSRGQPVAKWQPVPHEIGQDKILAKSADHGTLEGEASVQVQ